MNIDKCVFYVVTQNPMTRINCSVVDGQRKVPVTLPRLKCLQDLETGKEPKYFPYTNAEIAVLKETKGEDSVDGKQLTIRERKAYELFNLGVKVKYIAREFRDSNNRVRSLIHNAQVKLGVNNEA